MSWFMIIDRVGGAIPTRILLVADFSLLAKSTVSYAVGLARQFKSTVMIVHVVDPHGQRREGGTSSNSVSNEFRRERTEELRRIKSQISGAGIEAKAIYFEGSPVSTVIKRLAKQRRADLIVISAKLDGLALDSTALQLIGTSVCPVLTLGPSIQSIQDRRISFHHIVYVTDYSPQALRGAAYVLALADGVKAHISVCRIGRYVDDEQAQRDASGANFASNMSKITPQQTREWSQPASYSSGPQIPSDVLELAAKVNADLIILDGPVVAAWMKKMEDRTLHEILGKASCPVLTL